MAERSVVRVRSGSESSVEELRERVGRRFRSVGAAAGALRAEVRSATDPRRIARRHPAWVLGVAAGGGLLAARLVRRSLWARDEHALAPRLGWVRKLSGRPRPQPGFVMAVGAPVVGGALGLVTRLLVRRLVLRLTEEEVRPRPILVEPRRGPA